MSTKKISFILLGGVTAIVIIYAIFLILITWPLSEISISKAGVFGDSFGVLTSLFSGLAFSGMIITILLQKEELKLQRQELTYTRQEIKEQKDIFRIQSFNDSFYRLLSFYKQNLSEVSIFTEEYNKRLNGIEALSYLLKKLQNSFAQYKFQRYPENEDEQVEQEYALFLEIQKILINQSRYLNTIQSIYALIDTQLTSYEEKKIYWNLFASQLTAHEVKYLFYECLVLKKSSELRKYLHESKFFETRGHSMTVSNTHKTIYQKYYGVTIPKKTGSFIIPIEKSKLKIAKKMFKKRLQKVQENINENNSIISDIFNETTDE